jgi:hypothetical protein
VAPTEVARHSLTSSSQVKDSVDHQIKHAEYSLINIPINERLLIKGYKLNFQNKHTNPNRLSL